MKLSKIFTKAVPKVVAAENFYLMVLPARGGFRR